MSRPVFDADCPIIEVRIGWDAAGRELCHTVTLTEHGGLVFDAYGICSRRHTYWTALAAISEGVRALCTISMLDELPWNPSDAWDELIRQGV